jgi:hypothetical protein
MKFLFVGPDFCRQLLSDSQSPKTPLLLANTSYCKVCSGLAPYSLLPCLTHKKIPSITQQDSSIVILKINIRTFYLFCLLFLHFLLLFGHLHNFFLDQFFELFVVCISCNLLLEPLRFSAKFLQ